MSVIEFLLHLIRLWRDPAHGNLSHNRAHGKWRVRYEDGHVSQPFTYGTACDYRNLFGGEVERIPWAERRRLRLFQGY